MSSGKSYIKFLNSVIDIFINISRKKNLKKSKLLQMPMNRLE